MLIGKNQIIFVSAWLDERRLCMGKVFRFFATIVMVSYLLLVYERNAYTISEPTTYDMLMLDRINSYRQANGLSALEYDEDLVNVANWRVSELPTNFDHLRPNGDSYKTVYTELGLADKYEKGNENIAMLYGWDFASEEECVDFIFEAYKNSEAHNANILKPYWQYYGGSYLVSRNGKCYQIQVFAK